MKPELENCKVLTFDLFGTMLDLGGSLTPPIGEFLKDQGSDQDAGEFWRQLRHRQRIEQYQDTIVQLGHSGYLETVRRAFSYVTRLNGLDPTDDEIDRWMESWQQLSPFPDAVPALDRLRARYRRSACLVGLHRRWLFPRRNREKHSNTWRFTSRKTIRGYP